MADVTNQINELQDSYGGSNLSNPAYYSSTRQLNLSSASNSIANAAGRRITTVPYILNYSDTIGLFGAENYYVKIQLDIIDTGNRYTIVNDYTGLTTGVDQPLVNTYLRAIEDNLQDLSSQNDYEPSSRGTGFGDLIEPVINIRLENTGTGNIYNDSHIDARLYDKNHNELNEDDGLISISGEFYLGIHARNTRRLPYNISIHIGEEVKIRSELTDVERNSILP
jgi:hypothetical protein